jgi:hypothetical protein
VSYDVEPLSAERKSGVTLSIFWGLGTISEVNCDLVNFAICPQVQTKLQLGLNRENKTENYFIHLKAARKNFQSFQNCLKRLFAIL